MATPVRLPASTASRNRFAVAPAADRTVDGIVFDSKREAIRYAILKIKRRAGLITDIETQPSWVIDIGGKHFCRYTADFRYFDVEQNRIVIEEIKSTGTAKDAAYRLRRKAAELAHNLTIDLVLA